MVWVVSGGSALQLLMSTGLPGGGSAFRGCRQWEGGSGRQDQVMGSLQYPAQEFGFYSVAGGEDRGLYVR